MPTVADTRLRWFAVGFCSGMAVSLIMFMIMTY